MLLYACSKVDYRLLRLLITLSRNLKCHLQSIGRMCILYAQSMLLSTWQIFEDFKIQKLTFSRSFDFTFYVIRRPSFQGINIQ